MSDITNVAVIGAGQMGGGIAQIAAVAGLKVTVCDSMPDALARCKDGHGKRLARDVEKGKIQKTDADAALGRLSYSSDISVVKSADIVIEAIVEDAGVKKGMFSTVAPMVGPNCILATNTSSISITEIASVTGAAADRVIGMHFFYPVPVMKLVEVINGLQTRPDVTRAVISLAERMGKTAIPANDRAGFVSNRVLMPMINEAFYAWMEGVAEPKHLDDIMKLGCNFPMGPLQLADFIGLDTCAHIMEVLADGLNSDRYRPCPLLKQLVTAGRLGQKSGRGVYEYPPAGK